MCSAGGSGPVAAEHVVVTLIGVKLRPARAGLVEQPVSGGLVVGEGVAGGTGVAGDAAIGGGLCLAACCDIRIASPEAYFRAAGINNGLTATELGLSYLLPRIIGAGRANELMLTGRDMDAVEAERVGLVTGLVPRAELLSSAIDIADRIAGLSRIGVELTKKMALAGLESSSFRSHMRNEMTAQLYVRLTTDNWDEAVAARVEGRAPVFRD